MSIRLVKSLAVWACCALGIGGMKAPCHAIVQVNSIKEELLFTPRSAPFPSCHASTIVETSNKDLLVAFFGGTREGVSDVAIWTCRFHDNLWSAPQKVAEGKHEPCWNPVLFYIPGQELLLFYKEGSSPRSWRGKLKRSFDDGFTWSESEQLPEDIIGPVKNKPILLENGTLICGSSIETLLTWRCWVEITKDKGKTWKRAGPLKLVNHPKGIIQPTIFEGKNGTLHLLCRSRHVGKICYSSSKDRGRTWSKVTKTCIPNPDSGIDAVKLKSGKVILVYNSTKIGRSQLALAVSEDDGANWEQIYMLEDQPGEYSYPAIIQTEDGKVHVTYTWRRKSIKHVVLEID